MHVLDRALRQFRLNQHIPNPISRLTHIDRNEKHLYVWSVEHNVYMLQWEDRVNQIQPHTLLAEYMRWFWEITYRWIIQRVDAPTTYMPSAPYERQLVTY